MVVHKVEYYRMILFLGLCGKTLIATDNVSQVALPNFPSSYENNFNCHWILRASAEISQVEITVNSFVSEGCCDFLKVRLIDVLELNPFR